MVSLVISSDWETGVNHLRLILSSTFGLSYIEII